MHRVDSHKTRKLTLRILSYVLITILTIVTSAILLYAALGYRLNSGGSVVRGGLLLVDSRPVAADVYINGENKNDPTASQFVLPAGKYTILLKQSGYRDWSRTVKLSASGVENVYYPLIIPSKLTPKKQQSLRRPDVVSQSLDRKVVFLFTNTATQPQLLTLDSQNSLISDLDLPPSFKRQNGLLGDLRAVEWARDNRHLLVQQTVAGKARWLSIDTKNPLNSIDVTALLKEKAISDPHYTDKNASQLFALAGANLARFDLSSGTATQLLKNIKSYAPFSDKILSFVRYNVTEKQLEAGLLEKNTATVIYSEKTKDVTRSGQSIYLSFDDVYYLVVQFDGDKKATIYQNPLKSPILTKQLPFATVAMANSEDFKLSANNQFVLLKNAQNVVVYDFEHSKTSTRTLKNGQTDLQWLDSHRLMSKMSDGHTYLSDFDGQNQYKLIPTDYGLALFSNDYRTLFSLNKLKSAAELDAVSMRVQ